MPWRLPRSPMNGMGGALDLLLVTDLSPPEFLWGKVAGVAYVTKEMILAPMLLCVALWFAGGLTLENLAYCLADWR